MSALMPAHALKAHLIDLLGEDLFIALCQELGGQRKYIAYQPRDGGDLVAVLGADGAARLARAMAPATIRIPLARRERALYYRRQGLSNARIASRLGMTENGVGKLFAREWGLPDRGAPVHKTSEQLTLI